jgi:protein transport protein DSL1/ZW10
VNGNGNDWDAAWSDEEQEDDQGEKVQGLPGQDASHDDPNSGTSNAPQRDNSLNGSQDDDEAEAWGWGDEDDPLEPEAEHGENGTSKTVPMVPVQAKGPEAVREVTLTEKYTISSMPDPVLKIITSILEDAATLTQEVYS